MAANLQNALPKGSRLKNGNNEYVILKVLGAGGFGITYLVKTKRGNIPVDMAVKEHFMASVCERDNSRMQVAYSKPVAQQVESALKDFITEANRLNSLDIKHPNIIAIDEVFRANNTAYYVMEYISGPSIGKVVRDNKGKPFSEQEALAIISPILEAVQNLHNAHITHLDIKPDNILLDYDELSEKQRPVLIDFGLSKHYDESGAPTSTINLTGCSEGYAPMEQYAGIKSFTPQADVYALAATLYFMLTGQNPPMAANVKGEELRAALSGKCSPVVADAIVRAMHYQLDQRTQSVNEFINRLGLGGTSAPRPAGGSAAQSINPPIADALVEPVEAVKPVSAPDMSRNRKVKPGPPKPNRAAPTPSGPPRPGQSGAPMRTGPHSAPKPSPAPAPAPRPPKPFGTDKPAAQKSFSERKEADRNRREPQKTKYTFGSAEPVDNNKTQVNFGGEPPKGGGGKSGGKSGGDGKSGGGGSGSIPPLGFPSPDNRPGRAKKMWIIIIGIILALLAICGVAMLFLLDGGDEPGDTPVVDTTIAAEDSMATDSTETIIDSVATVKEMTPLEAVSTWDSLPSPKVAEEKAAKSKSKTRRSSHRSSRHSR